LKKVTGKYLEQRRGVQTQVETPTRTLKEKRLMAVTEATRNTPGLNSPAFSGLSDSDIYRMAAYTDRGLKLMANELGLANKVDKARRSQYKRGY
jgi:cytochrome c553